MSDPCQNLKGASGRPTSVFRASGGVSDCPLTGDERVVEEERSAGAGTGGRTL